MINSKQVLRLSIIICTLILLLKTYALIISSSNSILSSTIDSFFDLLITVMNYVAFIFARSPADFEHAFGHGKAEYISSFFQSIIMIISCLFLIYFAASDIYYENFTVTNSIGAIYISIICIVLIFVLVILQKIVIKRENNFIVRADNLHYKSDLLLNIAVIFSLVMFNLGYLFFDSICAILVGFIILISAIKMFLESVNMLLDRALGKSCQEKIIEIVTSFENVIGLQNLKTRQCGPDIFIQLDIELDETLSFIKAHEITHDVIDALKKSFPTSYIVIHQDPVKV